MVVVVFRSRLSAEAGADYSEMAAEMLATAKEMPGFVEFKSFKADDGERVSLVYWQDQETMAAWRSHPRHRIAQNQGRAKWYSEYRIEVAEVVRGNKFERP
ncbi:MAG TPA: antibiotic biosynthesis monooxygenase [Bryobacteraceae bacterium]|nr:antibiotic biosynthesis monooxygenase [Bryobacteraceae bacterium]